jgi:hypothetical protein
VTEEHTWIMLFGEVSTVLSCTVAADGPRFGVTDDVVAADDTGFGIGGEGSELAGVEAVRSTGLSFVPSPFNILLILTRSGSLALMLALPGGKTLFTRRTLI